MTRVRLNHVGVAVRDLDRAAAFYRRWFGFEVAGSFHFDDDPWMNRMTGLPGARGRALHMRGENGYLELFAFERPAPAPAARGELAGPGITHLGFEVEDLAGVHRAMAADGVPFVSEPQDPQDGSRAVYGRDPDGNVFELMQLGGGSTAFSLDALAG